MTRLLWPICGLLAASCARHHRVPDDAGLPPQSELAEEVAAAGQAAWDDAKLSLAPETTCLLDELRIVQPDDFARLCQANACLGWRAVLVAVPGKRRPQRMFVPIAYVHPKLSGRNLSHAALHEWCHAAGHCHGRWGGWWDAGHTDLFVWEQGGVWSVEARGERILDGTPEPGSLPEGDEGLDGP